MHGEARIQIRSLSVRLGGRLVLEDVSLDVHAGAIHALIGPNGAGKTTLIRSLLGAMPHQGTIRYRFDGRGTVGYVPQSVELGQALPMTVDDFLTLMIETRALPLGGSRRARQRSTSLLERVGALHLRRRRMERLSGGELQRVMLAQALHPVPEVLLLDEPSSNVDVPGQRQMERLLRMLRDELGVAIVLVAHQVASVLALADQATVLDRRLIWSGPADAAATSGAIERALGWGPRAGGPVCNPRDGLGRIESR